MATLKSWDQYVKDADREPLSLEMPNGETITITMPTAQQTADFNAALFAGKGEDAVKALLGAKNGSKLARLGKDAPAKTLDMLINDVLAAFGLDLKNSPASSS